MSHEFVKDINVNQHGQHRHDLFQQNHGENWRENMRAVSDLSMEMKQAGEKTIHDALRNNDLEELNSGRHLVREAVKFNWEAARNPDLANWVRETREQTDWPKPDQGTMHSAQNLRNYMNVAVGGVQDEGTAERLRFRLSESLAEQQVESAGEHNREQLEARTERVQLGNGRDKNIQEFVLEELLDTNRRTFQEKNFPNTLAGETVSCLYWDNKGQENFNTYYTEHVCNTIQDAQKAILDTAEAFSQEDPAGNNPQIQILRERVNADARDFALIENNPYGAQAFVDDHTRNLGQALQENHDSPRDSGYDYVRHELRKQAYMRRLQN